MVTNKQNEPQEVASKTTKKEWTKRPDPFGIESILWQDGYRVSLKESDANILSSRRRNGETSCLEAPGWRLCRRNLLAIS
jgi:hypothetical protein